MDYLGLGKVIPTDNISIAQAPIEELMLETPDESLTEFILCRSDSDQKLVSKIFRDHVEWKGEFEVNGIYVDDLREEEELLLLKDLRIGVNRDLP
ncbi:hypothetical protein HK098_008273 [Nowakowskiella sp. JEL0407]|nr:hypothetical protein HK098_008273 [Nowakowskiella sp. JEL0407]